MKNKEENTAAYCYELGRAAYERFHYENAVEYLSRAIEADPYLLRAYILRALAKEGLLDFDSAKEDFAAVIRLSPNSADGIFANTLVSADSEEETIEGLTRAIQADPTFALAYLQRAIRYGQIDMVTEALADFEKALELTPEDAHVFENRHEVYQVAEDYQAAIQDLVHFVNKTGMQPGWVCVQMLYYYSQLDDDLF